MFTLLAQIFSFLCNMQQCKTEHGSGETMGRAKQVFQRKYTTEAYKCRALKIVKIN